MNSNYGTKRCLFASWEMGAGSSLPVLSRWLRTFAATCRCTPSQSRRGEDIAPVLFRSPGLRMNAACEKSIVTRIALHCTVVSIGCRVQRPDSSLSPWIPFSHPRDYQLSRYPVSTKHTLMSLNPYPCQVIPSSCSPLTPAATVQQLDHAESCC